jgi:NADPH-dependent curcumin reductase CurA
MHKRIPTTLHTSSTPRSAWCTMNHLTQVTQFTSSCTVSHVLSTREVNQLLARGAVVVFTTGWTEYTKVTGRTGSK